MLKHLLIFSWLTMLLGCTPQPSDIHHEYQKRLAKFIDIAQPAQHQLAPLPSIPYIQVNSQLSINIVELGQLNHCRLAEHIAAHNNQLGKVATASERFKYHLRFVQLVTPCLTHPKSQSISASLSDKLELALEHKTRHMHVMFNHILSQEQELVRLTTLSATELGIDEYAGKTNSIEALEILAETADKIASKQFDAISPSELTRALELLNGNDYIRKLLTSSRHQIALNNNLTQRLGKIQLDDSVCANQQRTEQPTIMHNIFNMFYIKQLQPYQAQLTLALQDVSPLLARVWQFIPDDAGPKPVVTGDNHQALLQQLKLASKNHVIWWQGFYKQCNISPA